MAVAMGAMAASTALLAHVPADGSYAVDVLPGLLLFGAAIPLAFATVNGLTLQAAPPGAEGAASGLMNTAQWVGGALGAAAASAHAGPMGAGPAALAAGARDGFAMCAAAGVAGCAIAAASLRPSVRRRRAGREERPRAAGVGEVAPAVEGEA
jgi:hypothetical protein